MNAQGLPEYKHRMTGIVMVRLPGGTFWMGAQKEDPEGRNYDPQAEENEGPVHAVTLSPFLIGKLEVTSSEWRGAPFYSSYKGDEAPVAVSWDDIQEFEATTGLMLPTEAQGVRVKGWEHERLLLRRRSKWPRGLLLVLGQHWHLTTCGWPEASERVRPP